MPNLNILFLCIVYLTLPLAAAEDSVRTKDSLGVITDRAIPVSDTSEADDILPDSSIHGTLSLSGGDTVLVAVSDTMNGSLQDTKLIEHTLAEKKDDTLSSVPRGVQERSLADTIAVPKRALQKLLKNIFEGLRWILSYFKYFLFLLISVGIVSYTIFFYRKKIDSKRFMTSTRLSIMDREIQLTCKYIENHFSEPELSVKTICEALVTGPAFLEALFEHELGMQVSDFIAQVRINRAKIQINKQPDVDDEELLSQIGFTDRALFVKKFKEITGTSYEDVKASLAQNRN